MLKQQTHYENSKGEMVNPQEIATPHLESALKKAQREGYEDNVQILTEELARRNESAPVLQI